MKPHEHLSLGSLLSVLIIIVIVGIVAHGAGVRTPHKVSRTGAWEMNSAMMSNDFGATIFAFLGKVGATSIKIVDPKAQLMLVDHRSKESREYTGGGRDCDACQVSSVIDYGNKKIYENVVSSGMGGGDWVLAFLGSDKMVVEYRADWTAGDRIRITDLSGKTLKEFPLDPKKHIWVEDLNGQFVYEGAPGVRLFIDSSDTVTPNTPQYFINAEKLMLEELPVRK